MNDMHRYRSFQLAKQRVSRKTGLVGFTVEEQVRQQALVACHSTTEIDVQWALINKSPITEDQINELLAIIKSMRGWAQEQLQLASIAQGIQDHLHMALAECGDKLIEERKERERVVMQLSAENAEWRNQWDEAQGRYEALRDQIAGYSGINLRY